MDPRDLVVAFLSETHVRAPGGALTFGRAGDVVVDDANPYLHRVAGRFFWQNEAWWLENLGRRTPLTLVSALSTVHLPPAGVEGPAPVTIVPRGPFTVSFEAGGSSYELEGTGGEVGPTAGGGGPDGLDGPPTTTYGRIALTDEEHALVLALAEPVLRDPTAGPDALPANREVAHRLGWTATKFNRKLDYLCTRLTRAGVRGLQGGRGAEAVNRRWRLVEHAVASRMVTADDLDGS